MFTHIDTCTIHLHWNTHTHMTFLAIFKLYLACDPAVASVVFLCLDLKLKFSITCICYSTRSFLRIAIAQTNVSVSQVVQGLFSSLLASGVLGCPRNCFCLLKTSLHLKLWLSSFTWKSVHQATKLTTSYNSSSSSYSVFTHAFLRTVYLEDKKACLLVGISELNHPLTTPQKSFSLRWNLYVSPTSHSKVETQHT